MIASIIHRELLLSVVLEFMGDQRDENSHSWFGWSRQDHHIVQVSDDMEEALHCHHVMSDHLVKSNTCTLSLSDCKLVKLLLRYLVSEWGRED